jgi:hypothetical protein
VNTLFWMFVPDQALPLLIIVAGALVILGFRATGIRLLLITLLIPVLSPFAEAFLSGLPPWVAVIVVLIVGLSILRAILFVLLGRSAAEHAIGILAADIIRVAVVALVLLPFRIFCRAATLFLTGFNGHGRIDT